MGLNFWYQPRNRETLNFEKIETKKKDLEKLIDTISKSRMLDIITTARQSYSAVLVRPFQFLKNIKLFSRIKTETIKELKKQLSLLGNLAKIGDLVDSCNMTLRHSIPYKSKPIINSLKDIGIVEQVILFTDDQQLTIKRYRGFDKIFNFCNSLTNYLSYCKINETVVNLEDYAYTSEMYEELVGLNDILSKDKVSMVILDSCERLVTIKAEDTDNFRLLWHTKISEFLKTNNEYSYSESILPKVINCITKENRVITCRKFNLCGNMMYFNFGNGFELYQKFDVRIPIIMKVAFETVETMKSELTDRYRKEMIRKFGSI